MKKLLNKTILKTLAIIALVGGAIYFLFRYFGGTKNTNPLTGNSSQKNGEIADLKVADSWVSLFEFAKRGENVAIEFNQDVTLKDDDGKTLEIKKGNVLTGNLTGIYPSGGSFDAYNTRYFVKPVAILGDYKNVEIDPAKVVAVLSLEHFEKLRLLQIS